MRTRGPGIVIARLGLVLGLVVVGAAAASVGCGNPAGASTEGPVLFGKLCSQCHGPTGQPPAALVQSLGVRDLTDLVVRKHLTVARVTEQVRLGSANHRMPGFEGMITDPQLQALAEYVASPAFLTTPPSSPPAPSSP